MKLQEYYEEYWGSRKEGGQSIPSFLPEFLKNSTYYGGIVNCIRCNSKILDLGCGDGSVTQLYSQKGTVTGVDISERALLRCKSKGVSETIKHDLNVVPLPFNDATFDYVILTDVLEHVIDPLTLLEEVRRILRSGGSLIVSVPNFARLQNRFRMFCGDPLDILHWSKYGDSVEHLHWFTKRKLEHFLSKAGFCISNYLPAGLRGNFVFVALGFPNLASLLSIEAKKK